MALKLNYFKTHNYANFLENYIEFMLFKHTINIFKESFVNN